MNLRNYCPAQGCIVTSKGTAEMGRPKYLRVQGLFFFLEYGYGSSLKKVTPSLNGPRKGIQFILSLLSFFLLADHLW